MTRLIIRWLLLAAALLLIAHLGLGLSVRSYGVALAAALVLGLLNAVVRPVLILLTLPVTVVTLGIFLFVINAVMLGTAAWLLDGVNVSGWGGALLASLAYSVSGLVIGSALDALFPPR